MYSPSTVGGASALVRKASTCSSVSPVSTPCSFVYSIKSVFVNATVLSGKLTGVISSVPVKSAGTSASVIFGGGSLNSIINGRVRSGSPSAAN